MTTSAIYTTDFRHQFEAETHELLRRRFIWFLSILCVLVGFKPLADLITLAFGSAQAVSGPAVMVRFGFPALKLAVYGVCLSTVLRHRQERATLLTLTQWLVVFDGAVSIVASQLAVAGVADIPWQMRVFLTHLLACVFLPWTPWQAIRPFLPLLGLGAVAVIALSKAEPLAKVFAIQAAALAGVPGTLLCWLRHSRRLENSKLRFFQRRYGEMRQELFNARQLHESLLPSPRLSGPVRFRYRYEPMRHIGGDYLYTFAPDGPEGSGPMSLVVLDVTGHGIPAALTVNRLHGELERVFAEDPGVRPGEVLRLLNRYVHLTLATHSVYVTALCLRVDTGAVTVEYASGGHPPAFLRGVDGTIEELGSTAFVLGACRDADFDPDPQTQRFSGGDCIILYTDGATEARNGEGKMLGVAGLRRILATATADPSGGWPETILRAVDSFRSGPAKDDTLIVEVSRPLSVSGVVSGPASGRAATRTAAARG